MRKKKNRWKEIVKEIEAKMKDTGTSMVAQWLRLHAPNAGSQVQSLVRELDPACRR